MITGKMLMALCLSAANPLPPEAGSIGGVVVNATQDEAPVSGAAVVLRVELDGQLVVAAETTSDEHGRFLFDDLPADEEYVYLPGANRAGVHYPGPRLRLNRRRRDTTVTLRVHDTVTQPNPLIVRQHDIVIRPEQGALRVTETLLIENPSTSTYVGQPAKTNGRAATLSLSIPVDFVRTTFHKEFFGRRFTLIDDKLVTDVPWTPGTQQLMFTYVLPNANRHRVWKRPLDLPTSNFRITIVNDNPDEVTCNVEPASSEQAGEVVFASKATLNSGHVIRLELGRLPVPFMVYARWAALIVVVGLIASTSFVLRRRHRTNDHGADATHISGGATGRKRTLEHSSHSTRTNRRRPKQKQIS